MSTHSSALSTPASAAVPALFVSHGAPLFALEAGETGPALTRWGQELKAQFPGLRGVVLAGHGLFTWGGDSKTCYVNTVAVIAQAQD